MGELREGTGRERGSEARPVMMGDALGGSDEVLSQFVRPDFDKHTFIRSSVRRDAVSDDLAHLKQVGAHESKNGRMVGFGACERSQL